MATRNPAYVPFRLGALGQGTPSFTAVSAAKTGVTAGAGVATGAATAAVLAHTFGVAGSVAGPVGTVVGAVIGLAVGSLLTKNYLNVANVNADEDRAIAALNQYKRVAGQAPGRQFGLAAMRFVWKGALFAGHFPKNNFKLCYHNGCFKYLGQPSMVDDVLDKTCGDRNCFRDVLPAWLASRSSSAPTTYATVAARSQAQYRTASGMYLRGLGAYTMQRMLPPEMMRYSRRGFKGFGALGQASAAPVSATPDAVVFIDQFFIPAQAQCSAASGCGWAIPNDPVAHQLLYDVADAWLAANAGVTTTPFIAAAPMPAPPAAPIVAAGSTTRLPNATPAVSVQSPITSRVCTPYPPGSAMPAIACPITGQTVCQEGGCGTPAGVFSEAGGVPVQPYLHPTVTPLFSPTPQIIAAQSGGATTVLATTSANLDAQLASQGFTRVGTTSAGFPIYSDAQGNTYLYQNGALTSYGTLSQLNATGNVGGVLTDPQAGGTTALPASGPGGLVAASVPPGISSNMILLGGGALLLVLMSGRRSGS